jgi:hypothetical protein
VWVKPKSYAGDLIDRNENLGEIHIAEEYYISSSKPDNEAEFYFTRYFKGLIDDDRIYNWIWSTAEIHHLSVPTH